MTAVNYEDVRVPADFESDGCTCAPGWLPAVGCIRDACRKHDFLYSLGGTTEARKAADLGFRGAIISQARGRFGNIRAVAIANIYYIAVRCFGGRHWGRR